MLLQGNKIVIMFILLLSLLFISNVYGEGIPYTLGPEQSIIVELAPDGSREVSTDYNHNYKGDLVITEISQFKYNITNPTMHIVTDYIPWDQSKNDEWVQTYGQVPIKLKIMENGYFYDENDLLSKNMVIDMSTRYPYIIPLLLMFLQIGIVGNKTGRYFPSIILLSIFSAILDIIFPGIILNSFSGALYMLFPIFIINVYMLVSEFMPNRSYI